MRPLIRLLLFFPLILLLTSACTPRAPVPDPDLNGDGRVDVVDVSIAASCFGQLPDEVCACRVADSDTDGDIDLDDVTAVASRFGETGFPIDPPDSTAPLITQLAPDPAVPITSSRVRVTGRLDDKFARVRVNGTRATVLCCPAFFFADLDLDVGGNEIRVESEDLACNPTTANMTLVRVARDPDPTGDGRVDDADVSLVSSCVGLDPATTCRCRKTDIDGDLDVDADDLSVVSQSRGQTGFPIEPVDTTPPVLSIDAPTQGASLAQTPVTVSGSLDDASSSVSVNGVPASVTPGVPALFTADVPLVEGQNVLRALATDASCNEGSASVAVVLASGGPGAKGVIAGEVYDDTTGHPLAGATVELESLGGEVPAASVGDITDARGRYHFASESGLARMRISKPGHSEAVRSALVAAAMRTAPLDARLTPLAVPQSVSSVLGGAFAIGDAELDVPPGALASDLALAATTLSPQALVAPLPLGWSALSGIDVSPADAVFAAPVRMRLPAPEALPVTAVVRLARWDEQAAAWVALGEASRVGGDQLEVALERAGQYALTVADAAPQGPSEPIAGAPLPGLAASTPPPDFEAALSPSPRILFAEPEARTRVAAEALPAVFAPSGSLLELEIAERYDFADATRLVPESMLQDLTLQRVGGAEPALGAAFPVGPGEAFDPARLRVGTIDLAARLADAVGAPVGAVVGPGGGRVESTAGARVEIPAGAALEPLPVALDSLATDALALELPAELTLLAVLSLDMHGGSLAEPAELAIPLPAGLEPNAQALLVRVSELGGASRLELVALGERVGAELVARTGSLALPGVREGGRYLFLVSAAQLGFVTGSVNGPDGPYSGAVVTTDGLGLVAQTDVAGRFSIAAEIGPIAVTALDPFTRDEVAGSVTIGAPGELASLVLTLASTPPRVVGVSPADGAAGVARLASIAVELSEPVRVAANAVLADALVLHSGGARIAGSVSLSADRSRLAFVPAQRLDSDTLHQFEVAATLEDDSGHALGAAFVARFTTLDETQPAAPGPGQIVATIPGTGPGASSLVTAGPGTVEPGGLAVLANLRTGALTTLIANDDGSFAGSVLASRADHLELRLSDAAGNETRLSLGPFQGSDGSVVVGSEGGVVAGPGGVQVEIPAGALPDGTVVKVDPLLASELPIPAPDDYPFAGGVKLDLGGVTPSVPLDLAILAPPGASLDDQVIVARAVVLPGRTAWTVVDRAHLAPDGRYRTASPPFPGADSEGSFAFLLSSLGCVSYTNISIDFVTDFLIEVAGIPFSFLTGNVSSVTLPYSCDQPLTVQVLDPDTNAVIREIDARSPAQRDDIGYESGILSDDDTDPVILGTNTFSGSRTTRIEVRFSEPMDGDSLQAHFVVEDADAATLTGRVELFDGGRLAIFEPDFPFRLGQQYLVELAGSTDRAGNPLAIGEPITFTPFDPLERDPDPLGQDPALGPALAKRNESGALNWSTRDTATLGDMLFLANGLATQRENYEASGEPQRLLAVDVRNPFAPLRAGFGATGTNPRVLATVGNASLTTGAGAAFQGDLLLVAGGGRVPGGDLMTRFEIYDVRACTQHQEVENCLAGALHGFKLLSSIPGVPPLPGVPPETGVPQQIAVLHQRGAGAGTDTLLAYVVVSGVGLAAIDVADAFDLPAGDDQRGPDGLVRSVRRNDDGELRVETDFLDVAVLKNLVVSVALKAATGEFSLDLFSAQLTNRRSVYLPGPAARVGVLENFLVDLDQDGRVGTAEDEDQDPPERPLRAIDEIFDLALVASGPLYDGCGASTPCGELYVVDLSALTDLDHAEDRGVIARIPLPGPAFSVEVDRESLVAYVEVRGKGLALVDLATLYNPLQQGVAAEGLVDANGDELDDRMLTLIPKPDIFAGEIAIDHARGLAYVNGAVAGADVMRVQNRCNELSADFHPEAATPASPDEERRRQIDDAAALEKEKQVLLSVLVGAASVLSREGITEVALLEQGSGACFWRADFPTGCTSFQVGTSDHDIEVLVPQDQVAEAQGLLDIYLDEQNNRGGTLGIARLTLFGFSRDSILNAELLNGTPRNRSGDADGDLALGRQSLLLLWILEGEYVDGYPLRDDQGAIVSLADTLAKLKSKPIEDPVVPTEPSAIPRLEGYEWSLLQELNLYKTGAMMRVAGGCRDADLAPQFEIVSGPDFVANEAASHFDDSDFLTEDCHEQLHTVAKAAIRATLARLVADEFTNPRILEDLDRDAYRGPEGCRTGVGDTRNPPSSPIGYTRKRCGSFEEFIASLAVQSVEEGIGPFQATDLPSIFRFYCIKVGQFCQNRSGENFPILATDAQANDFIDEALDFIELAKTETLPIYEETLDDKPIGEIPFRVEIAAECSHHGVAGITSDSPRSALRACNRAIVGHKLDGDPGFTEYVAPPEKVEYVPDKLRRKNLAKKLGVRRIVQRTLRSRVANEGALAVSQAPFVLYEGDGVHPEQYTPKRSHVVEDFRAGERRVLEADDDGAPLFPVVFDLDKHVENVPGALAFFLDPERSVPEADKSDNAAAFFYYRLDRDNPGGPPLSTSPVAPVSTESDPICAAPPIFDVSVTARAVEDPEGSGRKELVIQAGQGIRLDYRVKNRRNVPLSSLVVRRAGRPTPVVTRSSVPGANAAPGGVPFEEEFVPNGVGTFILDVTASALAANGDRVEAPADRIRVRVVTRPCDAAIVALSPDPNPLDANGLPESQVMQGGRMIRYYRVIDPKTNQPIENAVVEGLRRELPGGEFLSFTANTDANGWIVHERDPDFQADRSAGLAFFAADLGPPESRHQIELRTVQGIQTTCPVSFEAVVKEREFERKLAAGDSISVGVQRGILILGGSKGSGFSLTEAATPSGAKSLQVEQSFADSGKIGLGWLRRVFKTPGGVKVITESDASVKTELGYDIGYEFGQPLDLDSCLQTVGLLSSTLAAQGTSLVPIPGVNSLLRFFILESEARLSGAAERRTAIGASAGFEVTLGGSLQEANAVGFDSDTEVPFMQGKVQRWKIDGTVGYSAKVGAIAGRMREDLEQGDTAFKTLDTSYSIRGNIDFAAGLEAGTPEADTYLEQRGELEVAHNITTVKDDLKTSLEISRGFVGNLRYGAHIDTTQLPPRLTSLSLGFDELKPWGFTAGLNPIGTNAVPGLSRSYAFTITDSSKFFEAAHRIAMLSGVQAAFVSVPEGGGVPSLGLQDPVQQGIRLFALADAYEETIENGMGWAVEIPILELTSRKKAPAELNLQLSLDTSVSHKTASGAMRKGRRFPLEIYRDSDPLIPGPLDLALPNRLLDCFGTSTADIESAFRTANAAFSFGAGAGQSVIQLFLNSPGVELTIDGASEPDLGEPFEIGVVGVPFVPIAASEAPEVMDPSDIAGDAAKPHYGVGGFFQFDPEGFTFAAPARLVMHYDDTQTNPSEESTLRIYAFDPLQQDWELVGGSVDSVANTVSADVQELRLFAIAPPMPAGTIGVEAIFEPGAALPNPTTLASFMMAGLRRNDGTAVPDGTLFTVRVVSPGDSALAPVGSLTSADASPVLPGVQRASLGGVIAFDAELPGLAGKVKMVVNSVEGTAFGEPVTSYP